MFSKELELSIASLFDKAHEANIQYITVEHLLLMILSDYEVKEFFKSEGIQLESIKQDLNEHLKDSIVKKIDQSKLNFSQKPLIVKKLIRHFVIYRMQYNVIRV